MLYDPARHEPLNPLAWDDALVRATIDAIARDARARFSAEKLWPLHPKDFEPGDDMSQPALPMYYGAVGTIWALHYLQHVGAIARSQRYDETLTDVRTHLHAWLRQLPNDETASYLMGDTPVLLIQYEADPTPDLTEQLFELIARNIEHPARELMWGSPGTMLAALHLYERSHDARWRELFRRTAERLHSQLVWSDEVGCHYWTQDLYGRESVYLDAVHGFIATAFVLIRGRALLTSEEWERWEQIIIQTTQRTAVRESGHANWPPLLDQVRTTRPSLMQFCHGSPGFVVCLGRFPSSALDDLLIEAGEATWAAGPLKKGANLCHGTGGNGYAFLRLFERTQDERWLDRARAFAMHGIQQMRADEREYGQLRYSLWTGDPGFAIYLWDCLQAKAHFPTLDVFFAGQPHAR